MGCLTWRKSSFSFSNGACLEVTEDRESVLVRDSRNPGGTVLRLTPDAWRALLAIARGGAPPARR
jgi:hypothetical protein